MTKKILSGFGVAAAVVLALPAAALAHVVVTPGQAGIGERVLFNVGVPNEKDVAVKSIKLDIPSGLKNVQPNVLAGWNITAAQDSRGNVTAIIWTGNIPAGQRADLVFKAQAPAKAATLDWKAYQTYADGTVVHWDQKPSAGAENIKNTKDDDGSTSGPYSVTKVVDDLDSSAVNSAGGSAVASDDSNSKKATLALTFSAAALALSIGSLLLRRRGQK